jgi:5-methyltetrahydropteroyltriglutamate--homocysteine methyltransferase
MFKTRKGEVALVCIDEPVLGFLNDPLLDYGAEGREALLKSWDAILREASSRGAGTSIHLHDTSDDLFWEAEHLGLVESHVDDPLYTLESTKKRLDETDKRLKASITLTLFDNLIESHLKAKGFKSEIQQRIGNIWTEINQGKVNPLSFIEKVDLMVNRLGRVVERFGPERVPYAGPECGMGGWPRYGDAIEGLRRTAEAVTRYSQRLP